MASVYRHSHLLTILWRSTGSEVMAKAKDISGQTYGRWLVVRLDDVVQQDGRRKWLCLCECGTERLVDARRLKNGTSKSCGCLMVEGVVKRLTTHNMTDTPTYRTWNSMRQRCDNPGYSDYGNYGGRGITYDSSWRTFANFLSDMGERPEGKTLDRIDVDGNYCKENCRWATLSEQGHNKRKRIYKNTTHPCKFIGVTWVKGRECWRVKLVKEGVVLLDTYAPTQESAANMYDNVSEDYYGDRPNGTIRSEEA